MAEKTKIILADINKSSLLSVMDTLTSNAYIVEQADSGHEIIEKIRSLRYDLAIVATDVSDIDGYRICRLVKESDRTRHIPVILLATYIDQAIRTEAMESGADELIAKPVNRAELLTRVFTLLRIKTLHDRLERLIAEKEEEKKQLTRRTHELRILSDIARIVISVKDSQKVLREIINNIVFAFQVEAAALFTLHDDRWEMDVASDRCEGNSGTRPAPDLISLLEDVRKMEKTVTLDDSNTDSALLMALSESLNMKIQKSLCSPVFMRGKVIGVLMIFNKKEGMVFEPFDISLLMTITCQIALAIENIQLFYKLSDFNKTLQTQISDATKALVELKNFNESILQSISSGIVTVDFSGTILFANKTCEDILGYSVSELTGKKLADIIGEPAMRMWLRPTLDIEGYPGNAETEIISHRQEKIFIGFTTTLRIDSEGKSAGFIVSFRDISQIKEMHDTIMRMDRLVSLGLLTSGIAHEIRNPLAGIKTMAQALEKEFKSDDQRVEYVQRILKQINRLNDLLKAFFTYAKPGRPEKKHHDLRAIVKDVRALVRQRCENDRIEFIEKYHDNLPSVFADGNQLEQVLINLVINALDAMGAGGKLTIEACRSCKPLLAKQNPNSALIEIRVTDTGPGIPKENLKSIFDPFFTTKPNGVGLGLSIVFRIVHEHGGEVLVESNPGEGTTFIIAMPQEEAMLKKAAGSAPVFA